jgi:hypothetical protein
LKHAITQQSLKKIVAILKIISKKQTRVETIINMNKQRRMFFNIWCISLWLLLFRVVGLKSEDHLRGLDGQHDADMMLTAEAELRQKKIFLEQY